MDDFQSLPEYQALVVAATPKPERSMGDSIIPEEPPQWREVQRLSKQLFEQWSNQLELHIYTIQAETSTAGFAGFERSLRQTYELLDTQWDSVHPLADEDDPEDMYYERVNFVQELSQQPGFLETLYRLPLVSVRGVGEFSTRDIDISAGVVDASEEDLARCQDGLIRGAFAESEPDHLQNLNDLFTSLGQLCVDVESLFVAKTDNNNPVSLAELRQRLQHSSTRFHEFADEYLSSPEPDGSIDTADESGTLQPTANQSDVRLTSSITSRQQVADSFDAILRYYQEYEPSSPVRLFVVRAKEFVDKSFFELLGDLVPEHRDNLGALLVQLEKQPLAYLLSDSYARYCSGALPLPQLSEQPPTIAAPAAMPASHDTQAVDQPAADQSEHAAQATEDSSADSAMEVNEPAPAPSPVIQETSPAVADVSSASLVIGSREQVIQVLNDIETFYSISEPASPIPLVLADMRKLVPKRFSELISEFRRFLPTEADAEGG